MKPKALLRNCMIFCASLLLARCPFLGAYPFASAVLCVLYADRALPFSMAGILAGLLTVMQTSFDLLLAVLPVCILIPVLLFFRFKKQDKLWLRQVVCGVAHLLPALTVPMADFDRVMMVISGLCAVAICGLLDRLWQTTSRRAEILTLQRADFLALNALLCLFVPSLPGGTIWGFTLRTTFCLAYITTASAACGIGGGCAAAVCCSLLHMVTGGDTTTSLALIGAAVAAGIMDFFPGGAILGAILGDLTVSTFLLKNFVLSLGIVNLVIGTSVTFFLQGQQREKLRRFCGVLSGTTDTQMSYIECLRRAQEEKLKKAAELYGEFARSFAECSRGGNFQQKLIEAAKTTCASCEKQEYCWNARKSDTLNEFGETAAMLCRREKLTILPKTLQARCRQPGEVLYAMREQYDRQWQQMEETPQRSLQLSQQCRCVSDMLYAMSAEMKTLPEMDPETEKEMYGVLTSRLKKVEHVTCYRKDGLIVADVALKEYRKEASDSIISALSEGNLGRYRCINCGFSPKGGFQGRFISCTRLEINGLAKSEKKQGENVCGDSYTLKRLDNGRYLAAISDGAGSGEPAARESEKALNLLEAFATAEVNKKEMFSVMNQLLLLKSEGEGYSTVDVTEINLEEGVLSWTKIGAVPGYILRGRKVEKVEADALPMGIVQSMKPASVKKLVHSGDVIVLVSDGIYDNLCREEDRILSLLADSVEDPPAAIAERLLNKAREGSHDDDRTVVVLKVEAA